MRSGELHTASAATTFMSLLLYECPIQITARGSSILKEHPFQKWHRPWALPHHVEFSAASCANQSHVSLEVSEGQKPHHPLLRIPPPGKVLLIIRPNLHHLPAPIFRCLLLGPHDGLAAFSAIPHTVSPDCTVCPVPRAAVLLFGERYLEFTRKTRHSSLSLKESHRSHTSVISAPIKGV